VPKGVSKKIGRERKKAQKGGRDRGDEDPTKEGREEQEHS